MKGSQTIQRFTIITQSFLHKNNFISNLWKIWLLRKENKKWFEKRGAHNISDHVDPGSKGLGSKYMVSVATTQFHHCSTKAAVDNLSTNEHDCVPIRLLFMDTEIEFHILWHKIVLLFWLFFFKHLSMLNYFKLIGHTKIARFWFAGHSLPNSGVRKRILVV